MSKPLLVDVRKHYRPVDNPRGYEWYNMRRIKTPFRTLQVYKCPACGALSNLVDSNGGGAPYGPPIRIRSLCPNVDSCWHYELHILVRAVYELEENRTTPAAEKRRSLDRLRRDYKKAVAPSKKLIVNDIVGAVDFSQVLVAWSNRDMLRMDALCPKHRGHLLRERLDEILR